MSPDEFDEFQQVWGAMSERYGKPLSAMALAIDFQAFSDLTLADVRRGLQAHLQHPTECRFFPMPGQIIAKAVVDDGRPGEEEAWTIALTARNEADTVVWTPDIAEAWNAARTVMGLGDKVGARMAFKEAYSRIVGLARRGRQPVSWVVCEGHDAARRADAVRVAVDRGLAVEGADLLLALPAPGEVPRLLAGAVDAAAVPAALLKLRDRLAGPSPYRPGPGVEDRERTDELRAESAALVIEYAVDKGIELHAPVDHDQPRMRGALSGNAAPSAVVVTGQIREAAGA